MKHSILPVLASLPLLVVGLAPTQAQDSTGHARPARGLTPVGLVFSGHSSDGNLQVALDQALARAQQAIGESSMISDAIFSWDLTAIHGVRGGFIGLRDIDVEISVR